MDPFELSVKRFDEFAGEYAAKFMDVLSYRHGLQTFCDSIVLQKPSILELACGPGNVARFIRSQLPEGKYLGIDLSPRMIELARQNLPEGEFKVMDVKNIRFLNQKFDAIVCSFCLPFLSDNDTKALIASCSACLNTNGVLYISTMEGDASRAGYESTSFSGDKKVFFNYHRREELEKYLIASGFQIVEFITQDYLETDGSVTIDLIYIARLP